MKVVPNTVLLLIVAALLAACAAPSPPYVPTATLEDTTWALIELNGQKARAARNISPPSLRFEQSQVQARGSTGCNSFFGRYELDGRELRFGPLASTRRACVDPEMNRQESVFLKALAQTRAWRITGDTLVLGGDAGDLARFAPHR